jgi:hypothetical protein
VSAELDKLSYSVANLAPATDLSVDTIQKAIKAGDLRPKWFGTKPIILRDEALRWLDSLADESSRAGR